MTTLKILQEIQVTTSADARGILDIAEFQGFGRFETKRVYYISNVPDGNTRGAHAHKQLNQVFFALSGNFDMTVTDGLVTETVELKAHEKGFFLPAGHWRDLKNFTSDAICLVLASEHYDENDYIRSFEEYLEWKKGE
jgi:mannose-6-phosphate isomerase-like protein (cupin superfamily)